MIIKIKNEEIEVEDNILLQVLSEEGLVGDFIECTLNDKDNIAANDNSLDFVLQCIEDGDISAAFIWVETSQGHSFWQKLHTKVLNLRKLRRYGDGI